MTQTATQTETRPPARYFAVQGGHIHTSACTHRRRVRAGHRASINSHMKELDGMTEDEVLAQFGAYCCSHCFYGAPSGSKLTAEKIDDMTGATARRERLQRKHEIMREHPSCRLLTDIIDRARGEMNSCPDRFKDYMQATEAREALAEALLDA